jgi:hypothetical protein
LIHILGFDYGLEIVFQDLGEVVLQLTAPEVSEDLRPVGRILKLAKVWLLFPCQNFKGSGFADAVGAHEAQNLSGTGYRQSMQLERVLRIAMCSALL